MDSNIKTLQDLSTALSAPSPQIEALRIIDPLSAAEESFASFTQHSLECVKKGYVFEDFIQEAIQDRIAEADFDQLTRLYAMVHASKIGRASCRERV